MVTTLVFREGRLSGRDPHPAEIKLALADTSAIVWVDLADPSQEEALQVLEGIFAFHPLTVEDCVAETPFPKLEDYGDYLYFVMHAVDFSRTDHFTTTELDFFLGRNFLVTFHRRAVRSVQGTLERVLKQTTLLRGPDRLAHTILDQLVENYKPAVDEIRRDLEQVETEALSGEHSQGLISRIVDVRKELSDLRRIIRPQRELLGQLAAGKSKLIRTAVQPYLRDLQDDLYRIEEQAASWQDQVILSFKIHLNRSAFEANHGVKVLTALTALALPLILVATWFAMNFEVMPGKDLPLAYPLAALFTLASTALMAWWLVRNKWL